MSNTLVVDKGLPPGLWLPTAEEPTDRFLVETFNRSDHPYEEVVELGMFAVALAAFDKERLTNGTLMPSRHDLIEIFNEGYGINSNRFKKNYGGIATLQRALGFYPLNYHPSKSDLVRRLSWFNSYYLPIDDDYYGSRESVEQVLEWGSRRRLLPSPVIVGNVLEGDRHLLEKSLGIERLMVKDKYTLMDAYRLAARAISECGGPITQRQLNMRYRGEYEVLPYHIIQTFCGSSGALWLEFGHVTDTKSFDAKDLINIGVRHAISSGDPTITRGDIDILSAAKRFPSRMSIATKFNGSIPQYIEAVTREYERYLSLQTKLLERGVSTEACAVACQKYTSGPEFRRLLTSNSETLAILSNGSEEASYALRIIKHGFDIEHETIMEFQLIDFKKSLKKLGITKDSQYRFIFGLIPHISYDHIDF